MNTSKMKRLQAMKYLGKYGISKSNTLTMLELYQGYMDFILANATGYQLPVGDFSKIITEMFSTVKIVDGTVKGIARRGPIVRPKPVIDRFNVLMIGRCQSMKNRFMIKYFTAKQLINWSEADGEIVDAEKVKKWLSESQFIFYNPVKDIYHFTQECY